MATAKKSKSSLENLVSKEEGSKHSEKMLGDIAEMIKSKGIDLASIGRIKNVSMYQTITKNEEGEAEVHNLQAIQFSPAWETGPEWPVVKQGPAIQLQKPMTKPKSKTKFKTAVIVPDIQFGFFRNKAGELEATHDEKAISLALQMMEDANPDLVVCVGDNLDLPEMGKYVTYPSYAQTTQASIDRATKFCAEMRQAAPNARIVWLAGNHEERMPKYLVQNAGAAYGLRRGHEPESWPVLSVPFLCRMDDFKVEYRPGYPAADLWINEKLRVIHGDRVKSNGSTAHIYLNQEKTSVLYGHIHRIEVAFKTREDYDGPRTIMAASPGCLARIDGAIPSTRGGVDLDGRPLTRHENWQQGLGFVTYEESGNHSFAYENVTIYNGWAMWRGKEYTA